MKDPKLIRVDGILNPQSRAIVIIPGMFTNDRIRANRYLDPILSAGWDGEIHYLWWDSPAKPDFIERFERGIERGGRMNPLAYGASLYEIIKYFDNVHSRGIRTGRKHLPGLLMDFLPGRKITFVAHSFGSYIIYKLLENYRKYPLNNVIEDIILLGGTVSREMIHWPVKIFRRMYNVFSSKDQILRLYKYSRNLLRFKKYSTPCGRKNIDEKFVPGIVNIDATRLIGNAHSSYARVFSNNVINYSNLEWSIKA